MKTWISVSAAGVGFWLAAISPGCATKSSFQGGSGAAQAGGAAGAVGEGGGAGLGTTGIAGAVATACSGGEVGCQGLVPEQCSEAGEWVPTRAACAVACLDGQCVECSEGAKQCRDGAVQECIEGSWVTAEVCENVCEGDSCVEACSEGQNQCNGARSLLRCFGGEYVADTECEYLCSNEQCTGECIPDTLRCNPDADNESQSCDVLGNWGDSEPCTGGTFCVAGDCRPCEPDAARCGPAGPQLCSSAGEWVNQGACSGDTPACFNGECVLCNPGDKRCTDNTVERCVANGSGWELAEACSGDTPACLESEKSCGKCLENETQCNNKQVQTCDDRGVWQTTEICSEPSPRCVTGTCSECDPTINERRCSDTNTAQTCSADGSWGASIGCTGNTPICRTDLNFVCGCEEGTARCRSNIVPELCDGGAWVGQSTCTGTLNYCLPTTGQCVDCVPGSEECQSGVAHACNSQGAWQSLNSCAGTQINCGGCDLGEACSVDGDCDSGACVGNLCSSCHPGDRQCVGVTPFLCSNQGAWTDQGNCTGNTPVCLASTGFCAECNNGTSQSCGNCNLGTQACSNNQWGACSGAPNLQTSNQHCGACGNACGARQECVQGTCVCSDGNHGCNSTTPPCYADADVAHCGSSCLNCTQFSGAASCDGVGCVCEDYAFSCSSPSSPACGDWDFEAPPTTTGWRVGDYIVNRAVEGNLFISTNQATTGTRSLAARVIAPGGPVYAAEFEVQLCPSGTPTSLPPIQLSYDIYAESDPGYAFPGTLTYVQVTNTISDTNTDCGFFIANGDTWNTSTCFTSGNNITHYNVVIEFTSAWQGTIYIDNFKITPS